MFIKKHERLLIWRRRKKWSPQQAAKFFGVGHRRYRRWEHGDEKITHEVPELSANLTPGERYLVRRRRLGLTQEEIGHFAGVTRSRVSQVERTERINDRLEQIYAES